MSEKCVHFFLPYKHTFRNFEFIALLVLIFSDDYIPKCYLNITKNLTLITSPDYPKNIPKSKFIVVHCFIMRNNQFKVHKSSKPKALVLNSILFG